MTRTAWLPHFAAARVVRVLGALTLGFLAAHLAGTVSRFTFGHDTLLGVIPFFDLDEEHNAPAYYSLLLMLGAALLLAAIAALERSTGSSFARKWAVLACGFLLMGFDESYQFHEQLTGPMRVMLEDTSLGALRFAWVVPGVALVVLLLIYFWQFLAGLPIATKRRFRWAAATYLGGAIGVEVLGGQHVHLYGADTWGFDAWVALEEGMEMTGLVLFIRSLLLCIEAEFTEVTLRFAPQAGIVPSRASSDDPCDT